MKRATIQTKHGDLVGYESPFGVLVLVRPTWLTMDGEYQRPYDESWAQEIANNWDNTKARPVNARLRDGLLYITNGQHTVNAAVKAGVPEVLAIVNNGTPSRENEAKEFVDFQTKVKRMRPFDVYRASLVARDPDALIVRKVAADLGIAIVAHSKSPEMLHAITAVRRIAEPETNTESGLEEAEQRLRDVLEVAMVWDDAGRFRSELLTGIATALDSQIEEVVIANAKRFGTGDAIYRKANEEAGGRGYRTIALIALYLARKRSKKQPHSAVHVD